jgi:nitronate monooxygenase
LTAAVAGAGGYGFVAAGYLSAEGLRGVIATTRKLTGAPFGVNLFVPPAPGDPAEVGAYAAALQPEAARLGVALGEPRWEDDAWEAKLDVVEASRVHLVSSPIQVAVTVTSVFEAECRG